MGDYFELIFFLYSITICSRQRHNKKRIIIKQTTIIKTRIGLEAGREDTKVAREQQEGNRDERPHRQSGEIDMRRILNLILERVVGTGEKERE